MKPTIETEKYSLYLADCLDVMREMEAGSVDAVITDPPYGLNDGNGKVSRRNGEMVSFSAGNWDNVLPLDWIEEGTKLLVDGCWIAVFTDKLSVKTVWDKLASCGNSPKQTFYWIKNNPPPQPRDNFCSGVETAVLSTKGAVKKWNGGGATVNYYHCPLVSNADRVHETQKPVPVMSNLINLLTNKLDIVFDPFMGSGTTGVACMQLGRKFIGIEIDPAYFDIASKRIARAAAQMVMPI